jgi:hypothetical protein
MKQSFILSASNSCEFYHCGPYSICGGFVWNLFGLACPYIEATITNNRPHQSRWKKVTMSKDYHHLLSIGGSTFTPLSEHRNFLNKYGGVLWIKISPAKKEDFDKYTVRTEEHEEFRDI